jgi:TolB-like protein
VLLGLIDPARIHVVARTSSRTYKGTSKRAAQIGSELGADYLVESSIREEGTRIRVTSKLIRVSDQLRTLLNPFPPSTEVARRLGARVW